MTWPTWLAHAGAALAAIWAVADLLLSLVGLTAEWCGVGKKKGK